MTVETQKQNEVCAVATAKAFSFRTVLVARGIHFNQVGSFAGYDWLATVYGRDDIEIILKDTGDLASSREDARVRYKMGPQSLSVKLLEMSHGQWLVRNFLIHDKVASMLALEKKEISRSLSRSNRLWINI